MQLVAYCAQNAQSCFNSLTKLPVLHKCVHKFMDFKCWDVNCLWEAWKLINQSQMKSISLIYRICKILCLPVRKCGQYLSDRPLAVIVTNKLTGSVMRAFAKHTQTETLRILPCSKQTKLFQDYTSFSLSMIITADFLQTRKHASCHALS